MAGVDYQNRFSTGPLYADSWIAKWKTFLSKLIGFVIVNALMKWIQF